MTRCAGAFGGGPFASVRPFGSGRRSPGLFFGKIFEQIGPRVESGLGWDLFARAFGRDVVRRRTLRSRGTGRFQGVGPNILEERDETDVFGMFPNHFLGIGGTLRTGPPFRDFSAQDFVEERIRNIFILRLIQNQPKKISLKRGISIRVEQMRTDISVHAIGKGIHMSFGFCHGFLDRIGFQRICFCQRNVGMGGRFLNMSAFRFDEKSQSSQCICSPVRPDHFNGVFPTINRIGIVFLLEN